MVMGKKFRVEFETTEPIGADFVEGMVRDGVGQSEGDIDIATNIKVVCLKELTPEQYKEQDIKMKDWMNRHSGGE